MKSEIRDGMRIDWDAPIETDDGLMLRADVFRPTVEDRCPVIDDGSDAAPPYATYPMKGVGPFTHTDPRDRPPHIFTALNTLHFGAHQAPYLLLPIIPPN